MSITNFHFSDYLNRSYINTIKTKFGFTDEKIIEQFIMDFEILYHIHTELKTIIVKGGMSVPFHIDKKVRRLSQDIDLVTPMSKNDVEDAMKRLDTKVNGLFKIGAPYKPNGPTKSLPLLTYYVPFRSTIANPDAQVKIEFFYDFKEDISTTKINSDTELIDFKLDYSIEIFDKASLIGDKLTTLGFETIGVPLERRSDAVKHIYDIALLIREISDKSIIEKIPKNYDIITEYENSFLVGKKFLKQEIIDDTLLSLDSLLVTGSGYSLEKSHEGRYNTFKTQLLGNKNSYLKSSHVNDILLIKLLSQYLKLVINGSMNSSKFIEDFSGDLEKLKTIISQNATEKRETRKEIIQSYDTKLNGFFINTIPQTEQVFLYSTIEKLKK